MKAEASVEPWQFQEPQGLWANFPQLEGGIEAFSWYQSIALGTWGFPSSRLQNCEFLNLVYAAQFLMLCYSSHRKTNTCLLSAKNVTFQIKSLCKVLKSFSSDSLIKAYFTCCFLQVLTRFEELQAAKTNTNILKTLTSAGCKFSEVWY